MIRLVWWVICGRRGSGSESGNESEGLIADLGEHRKLVAERVWVVMYSDEGVMAKE